MTIFHLRLHHHGIARINRDMATRAFARQSRRFPYRFHCSSLQIKQARYAGSDSRVLSPLMRSARPLSFRVSASSDLRPVLTITPALSGAFPGGDGLWTSPRCRHWSAWVQLLLMPLWTLRMLLFHGVSKFTLPPPPLTLRSRRLLKAFETLAVARFPVIAFKAAAGADVPAPCRYRDCGNANRHGIAERYMAKSSIKTIFLFGNTRRICCATFPPAGAPYRSDRRNPGVVQLIVAFIAIEVVLGASGSGCPPRADRTTA